MDRFTGAEPEDPRQLVIIGSGPAGAAAAVTAARAGLPVMLISPARASRQHAIESLHPGVAVLLSRLGLRAALDNVITGTYDRIACNGTVSPLNPYGPERWEGWHIDRQAFHEGLHRALQKLPVTFCRDEVRYIQPAAGGYLLELRSGRKLRTAFLIDASGSRRLAGHRLGLQETYRSPPLICLHRLLPGTGAQPAELFVQPGGWEWKARLANGQTAVTGLMPAKAHRGVGLKPEKVSYSNVRWRLYDQTAGQGFLLAGDAAGQLDPAAGQGVLMALLSGIRAAETFLQVSAFPGLSAFQTAAYHNWFTDTYEEKALELKKRYHDLGMNTADWPED